MREIQDWRKYGENKNTPFILVIILIYIKGCDIFKVQVQSSHQTKTVAGGLEVTHYCEFTKYIKFYNFIQIQNVKYIFSKMCLVLSVLFCDPISPSHCIIFKRLICTGA